MAIDICNSCTIFQNHIQDLTDAGDTKNLEILKRHFKAHLLEASFGYQANAAMIDQAKRTWAESILKTYGRTRQAPKIRGGTIHVTIDWDKDRNEFQRQHKKFYNQEKPQFISLNIKIEPETDKGLLKGCETYVSKHMLHL